MVTRAAVDFLQNPSRNTTSVNLAKHFSAAAAEDDDDDDDDDGCAKNLKQSFYFSPLERLAPIFTPTWPPLWLLMLPGAANKAFVESVAAAADDAIVRKRTNTSD